MLKSSGRKEMLFMRCNLDKTVSWPFVDTFTRCLEKGFIHLHTITNTSKEFQKYNNKLASQRNQKNNFYSITY